MTNNPSFASSTQSARGGAKKNRKLLQFSLGFLHEEMSSGGYDLDNGQRVPEDPRAASDRRDRSG